MLQTVYDALITFLVSGIVVWLPYVTRQWRRRGPSCFFTWPCFGYVVLGELLVLGLCFIVSTAVSSTYWSNRLDWLVMVVGALVLCALHYLVLFGAHHFVGTDRIKRSLGIG